MHRASIKDQAAQALLGLPTNGENKTDLNDAFPVLTVVRADKAEKAVEND